MLKVAMLSTGEEVLHGDIVDTNAAWLSREFFQNGFALNKRSTVGDAKNVVSRRAINAELQRRCSSRKRRSGTND